VIISEYIDLRSTQSHFQFTLRAVGTLDKAAMAVFVPFAGDVSLVNRKNAPSIIFSDWHNTRNCE
jgi:hypothetical protein